MKTSEKIRVAVLYGGRSAEHEISLQSAANVMEFLDKSRFEVVPIGIDKQGNWFVGKEYLEKNLVNKIMEPEVTWFTPEWIGKPATPHALQTRSLNDRGLLFDVVFPAVHGMLCEDGTLQGLLELANIPYVGCGVLSSAMGMDKDISKRLASFAGIAVPPYLVLKEEEWLENPAYFISQIKANLGYPVFIKPANTGSSIGINKVKTPEQLEPAILKAFHYDHKVLIEKGLDIIELEVAVLQSLQANKDPIVSVVGEIKPRHEFYSYEAKYLDEKGAELIIPAAIPKAAFEAVRDTAKKLFQILECEGMARVDLFLDKNNHQIYFNEINTLPGFTQISMYPKLLNASGISYKELLTQLVELAINRHKNKARLVRNYLT